MRIQGVSVMVCSPVGLQGLQARGFNIKRGGGSVYGGIRLESLSGAPYILDLGKGAGDEKYGGRDMLDERAVKKYEYAG